MLACCELISSPLRLSVARLQSFVLNLHNSYHELHRVFDEIKHHRKRVARANEFSIAKAQSELNTTILEFQKKYSEILYQYDDPYMEKVRVHYPELHRNFQVLRDKTAADSKFKDLFPKEPS